MVHVLYSTDGKGNWWRREWAKQCPHKVFLGHKCQGVAGHDGVHWCYGEDGDYKWENQDEDIIKETDIAGGSTPPDHKDWVSPKKMVKKHYMNHFTDSEITDEKMIARLEKDNPPEKGASVTRPVPPEEWKKIEAKLKKDRAKRKK